MAENEKVCSCFGHSDIAINDDLKARTKATVEKAIADGFRIFLFGGISNFDDLVYETVSVIKVQQPELKIKRVFCFALDKQLRKPPHWFDKSKEYEAVECPAKDFDYWYTAIYYRNCAMIDKSHLVLFCTEEREGSGSYKAYKYAVKKHKAVINLK